MFEQPKEGPVVMIGPGTGVVPFIGFLETWNLKPHSAPTYLYFGCRKNDSDFIFKDFLNSAKEKGLLTELKVAFSRDEHKKQYV
jgi:sulfite reductase (NADPH) flavoprotein alpha-component